MPDAHEPIFEVRDPVHGFVKLTKAEREVVNCPTYQRLRDIRQLAMGHMVYPGANHTRFEHSLGCLHLSSRALDLLCERQAVEDGRPSFQDAFSASEDAVGRGRKILRLAALLHDLGHPPFSHSGEHLLPVERVGGAERQVSHETMTARLIRNTEIREVIERHYGAEGISCEHVIAVATSPKLAEDIGANIPWQWFLNEILTGELGSDRMDYLLRDAHHSGQESGRFDYNKLLNAMTLVPLPKEDRTGFKLGLDEGGWLVAEQMVAARYLMYISLYFHKTKRVYEKHLEKFLAAWLEQRSGSPTFPTDTRSYAALTDSTVLAAIFAAGGNRGDSLHLQARPFLDRSHLRLAREVVLADNWRSEKDGRRVPDRNRFDKLVEHVRLAVGLDEILVDTADHSGTKMFQLDSKILVLLDGRARYLDELSELVRGMSSRIWRGRIYCAEASRARVRAVCEGWLEKNPMPELSDGSTG